MTAQYHNLIILLGIEYKTLRDIIYSAWPKVFEFLACKPNVAVLLF